LKAKQRGQGLVEFALILPVLLVMLVTIFEGAKLLGSQMRVDNEAREIARLAARGTVPEDMITYSGDMLLEGSMLRLSYVTVNLESTGEFSSKLDEYFPFGLLKAPRIDSVLFIADQKAMLNTFVSIDWSSAFTDTANIENYDIEVSRGNQHNTWLTATKETAALFLVEYNDLKSEMLSVFVQANYLGHPSSRVYLGRYEVNFNMELINQPYRVIVVEIEQPYTSFTGLLDFIMPKMLYSKAEMRVLPIRGLTE